MYVTYFHFKQFSPKYVGEGSLKRSKTLKRGSVYGDWLKKHGDEHICILQTSSHGDKVSAVLQEQGFIRWIGRKITNEGTLMNVSSYGSLPVIIPDKVEKIRVEKITKSLSEDKSRYTLERSSKIAETRKHKWKQEHRQIGKLVQSLMLKSKEVPSPFSAASKSDHWGLKFLQKCLGLFPTSVYRRIIAGEDYGGSPDYIDEFFFVQCVDLLYYEWDESVKKRKKRQ